MFLSMHSLLCIFPLLWSFPWWMSAGACTASARSHHHWWLIVSCLHAVHFQSSSKPVTMLHQRPYALQAFQNGLAGSQKLDIRVESLSFPGSKAEVNLARSTVDKLVQDAGAEWHCMAIKGKGAPASQQATKCYVEQLKYCWPLQLDYCLPSASALQSTCHNCLRSRVGCS